MPRDGIEIARPGLTRRLRPGLEGIARRRDGAIDVALRTLGNACSTEPSAGLWLSKN